MPQAPERQRPDAEATDVQQRLRPVIRPDIVVAESAEQVGHEQRRRNMRPHGLPGGEGVLEMGTVAIVQEQKDAVELRQQNQESDDPACGQPGQFPA